MKRMAFRKQDQADVLALLNRDADQIPNVTDYLAENAPAMLIRLGQVLGG